MAAGLNTVYGASTDEAALRPLNEFYAIWEGKYPMIGRNWKDRWTEIAPIPAYPPEIRKVMYTTNAIELLDYCLRKVTRNPAFAPEHRSGDEVDVHGLAEHLTEVDDADQGMEPGAQ
jgi:transposase-like protein